MEKRAFLDRLIWGSDGQEVMVYQAFTGLESNTFAEYNYGSRTPP